MTKRLDDNTTWQAAVLHARRIRPPDHLHELRPRKAQVSEFEIDTTRPQLAPPNRTTDHAGIVETAESKARGRSYERYLAAYEAAMNTQTSSK